MITMIRRSDALLLFMLLILPTSFLLYHSEAHAALTNNGNGTVTDSATGLVWQQSEGGSTTWGEALNYCEGLTLGGMDDWRLPNVKELESLTDDTLSMPAINTTYFPDAYSAPYWSSTSLTEEFAGGALSVSFYGFGIDNNDIVYSSNYVRCVRGGHTGTQSTNRTLTVHVGGTGTGTVSSAPDGIMCEKAGSSTASCSNTFTENVTLTATRTVYSVFKEWSSCVGTGTCLVTMDTEKSVTATFNALHIGTDYPTLQEVYDASPDSSVIQLLQSSTGETVGTLIPNRDVVVKLSGGYDNSYLTIPGWTAITGPVRISKGKVIPEWVAVK